MQLLIFLLFAKLILKNDKNRRIIIKDAVFCEKVGNQTKKTAQGSIRQRGTAKTKKTGKIVPALYQYADIRLSKCCPF